MQNVTYFYFDFFEKKRNLLRRGSFFIIFADMDEEGKRLLRENNEMLKELLEWKRKVDSENYKVEQDLKDLCIDVVGNLMSFNLERGRETGDVLKEILGK